jgi:hypothetical protein
VIPEEEVAHHKGSRSKLLAPGGSRVENTRPRNVVVFMRRG